MKTVGNFLKTKRNELGISLSDLEKKTKIKSSFINAIENENWEKLPDFPIVLGFVKNISLTLNIDEKISTALLKRDFPPTKIRISPKPDIKNKLYWGPKMTFLLFVATFILIFFGYLAYQYKDFMSPPKIDLVSPIEGQIIDIKNKKVNVFGSTNSDVQILINNQPVIVDENGKFNTILEISENTNYIEVSGISRSGKATTVRRKIEIK